MDTLVMRDIIVILFVSITGTTVGNHEPDIKISNAIVKAKSTLHSRVKRALPVSAYTQAEKDATVAKHNEFRKDEPSSNMQYMRWDEDLASMAQEWANRCNWEHGQPEENNSPWSSLGQNLWASSGSASSPEVAVNAWHSEISYYNYDSKSCQSGKACGHYTQVVWATTTHVGCGIHTCTPADGGDKTSGDYIVCNYGPPGNYRGASPYKKGDPCSACSSGKFWCKGGMCDDCKGTSGCTCKAKCWNCGTIDQEDCSCSCTSGWRGNTCQDICEDTHENCGASPGWPRFWCNDGRSYVDNNCFAMCGSCVVDDMRQTCDPVGDGGEEEGEEEEEEDVCEGVTCQNGGTPTASGSTCKCTCPSEWQGDDCSENVEQAEFGIKVKIRMSLADWDDVWNVLRPLVAEAITSICNTNTWYTTCCPASSLEGVSFDPELAFMTTSDVKLGAGFPKENSPLVIALLYAQAQANNNLCNAGATERRKREAQGFLPQDLVLEAVEEKQSEIDTALQDCCDASVDTIEKAEVYADNSAFYPVTSMLLMALTIITQLIL